MADTATSGVGVAAGVAFGAGVEFGFGFAVGVRDSRLVAKRTNGEARHLYSGDQNRPCPNRHDFKIHAALSRQLLTFVT